MQYTKYLSVLSLVIAVAAFGKVYTSHDAIDGHTSKTETAYERVMRTRTLRCGYALWPTLEDIDPTTKVLKGLVPDFTNALAAKLGLKVEWVQEVNWGEQVEALNTGKFDALCSADGPFVYSAAAFVDYTDPMTYEVVYLYGRQGETRFKTLADADKPDVTISAIDGDISSELVSDKTPHAHRLDLPGSADAALVVTNVMTGKADLIFEDAFTVSRANLGDPDHKLVKILPEPFAVIGASFSVAKGQADLLNMLNQGFQLLQATGESDKILDVYDPERNTFYRPNKTMDAAVRG